jgi:hypothetical protein
MAATKSKKQSDKALLAQVKKEMAKARSALSARRAGVNKSGTRIVRPATAESF